MFPALHRSFQKAVSAQHHDQDEAPANSLSGVVITSTGGENAVAKKGGARVHLSELEVTSSAQTIQVSINGGSVFDAGWLLFFLNRQPKMNSC